MPEGDGPMDAQRMIAEARDVITVKRVFGEPYEKDGITIIPAATMQGGGGGEEAKAPPVKARVRAGSGSPPGPPGLT